MGVGRQRRPCAGLAHIGGRHMASAAPSSAGKRPPCEANATAEARRPRAPTFTADDFSTFIFDCDGAPSLLRALFCVTFDRPSGTVAAYRCSLARRRAHRGVSRGRLAPEGASPDAAPRPAFLRSCGRTSWEPPPLHHLSAQGPGRAKPHPGARGPPPPLQDAGKRVFFVTNNATKHRREVQRKFAKRGLDVRPPLCHPPSSLTPPESAAPRRARLLDPPASDGALARCARAPCLGAQVPAEAIITAGSAAAEYLISRGLDSVYLIGEPGLAEVRPARGRAASHLVVASVWPIRATFCRRLLRPVVLLGNECVVGVCFAAPQELTDVGVRIAGGPDDAGRCGRREC